MIESSDKRFYLLDLTAMFVAKNKEFTQAIKDQRPHTELAVLHSELQEIYNHITSIRRREVA
jgi:hypothetical protein